MKIFRLLWVCFRNGASGTSGFPKSDWEKLGIGVDIQVVPDIPSSFQVLITAQTIPPDPDQYNYWHSTKSTNLTGLKNPRIDKNLEDGRKTFDPKERKVLYFDFQKTLCQ
mgnify:CR=1 FL=1